MTDFLQSTLQNLLASISSWQFIFSPVYILTTVLIAFGIWRYRGGKSGFLSFLLPREVYRHPSTLVDLKVLLFNLVFFATGALAVLVITPIVTYNVLLTLNGVASTEMAGETTLLRGLLVALLLFLTQDFCRFINHYLHHKHPVLWPFHAVHHSAEVLSPITFMRAHPVYYAIQRLIISTLIGLMQGLVLYIFVREIDLWVIYAGTIGFQVYILLGGHLRHSHIRVTYGRVLEHVLISPAQHQVHHSSDLKHHDKNFGEIFAIWDWMFGTLYIADGDEELVFGIADGEGNRIEQPHPTLRAALVQPFVDSGRALREMTPFIGKSEDPSALRKDA